MADYYDRVEAQLVALTDAGAHRRRRPSIPRVPIRGDLVAFAASVLLVGVVVTAFLGLTASQHRPRQASTVGGIAGAPVTLTNTYPARLPVPTGSLVCDTDLGAPRGGSSATGRVEIYNRPPTRFEMLLTGKGLRPIGDGELEAVWVLPAVTTSSGGYQLQRSARPQLLGVIQPSVGAMGRLSVESLLPQGVAGTYQILITVQPQAELLGPGTVVLEGFISF